MYNCSFVVDENPYCIWDWDLPERNLNFLEGIDPSYFRYVVENHVSALDTDERMHAALAIRLAYSQALETFMALLGAVIQAPQCPLGWILKYQPRELRSLFRKFNNGEKIMSRLEIQLNWKSIANEVLRFELDDQDKTSAIKGKFEKIWQRFSYEFLDNHVHDEYNGIKHGLRVRSGGVALSIGIEETEGVACPPERMSQPMGSEFGTSHFLARPITQRPMNFRAHHAARNWSPFNLAGRVVLLAMSIGNIVSYLKIAGGISGSKTSFSWPASLEDFDLPWAEGTGFISSIFDTIIQEADIEAMSKEDILHSYE